MDVSFRPPEWSSRQPLGYFAGTTTTMCRSEPVPNRGSATRSLSDSITLPAGRNPQQESSDVSAQPTSVASTLTAPQLPNAHPDAIAQLQQVLRSQSASGLTAANMIPSEGTARHPNQSAPNRAAQSSAGQGLLPTPFATHSVAFTADTALTKVHSTEAAPGVVLKPACSRLKTAGSVAKQEWNGAATDTQAASDSSAKAAGLGLQAELAQTHGFSEMAFPRRHVQGVKQCRGAGVSEDSAEDVAMTVKLQSGQEDQNYEGNEEERRKTRRRATNRESAKRIRHKREEEMQFMRRQVVQLEAHKTALGARMGSVEDCCSQLTAQLKALKQAWCSTCIENVKLYKKIFELRKALNPGAADAELASWNVLGSDSTEDAAVTAEPNGPVQHTNAPLAETGTQARAENGCSLLQQLTQEERDTSAFIMDQV